MGKSDSGGFHNNHNWDLHYFWWMKYEKKKLGVSLFMDVKLMRKLQTENRESLQVNLDNL